MKMSKKLDEITVKRENGEQLTKAEKISAKAKILLNHIVKGVQKKEID